MDIETIAPNNSRRAVARYELDDNLRSVLNEHFDLKMMDNFICIDGAIKTFPAELAGFIDKAIEAYDRGDGISLVPRKYSLSTQEAADFLNISRSTLIRLLEGGKIKYSRISSHRKIYLRDLVAYKRQRDIEVSEGLFDLVKMQTERGDYDE